MVSEPLKGEEPSFPFQGPSSGRRVLLEDLTQVCRGASVTQWAKHPTSAQVTISQFASSSPASGSALTEGSLEPAWDSMSLSLSQIINKHTKKLKHVFKYVAPQRTLLSILVSPVLGRILRKATAMECLAQSLPGCATSRTLTLCCCSAGHFWVLNY